MSSDVYFHDCATRTRTFPCLMKQPVLEMRALVTVRNHGGRQVEVERLGGQVEALQDASAAAAAASARDHKALHAQKQLVRALKPSYPKHTPTSSLPSCSRRCRSFDVAMIIRRACQASDRRRTSIAIRIGSILGVHHGHCWHEAGYGLVYSVLVGCQCGAGSGFLAGR